MKTSNANFPVGGSIGHGIIIAIRILCQYLTLILFCCSCASVYIPTLRNVPLMSSQGEFQATGSIGNGMNASSAYAITNHIGIMGDVMYANDKWRRYHDNTYRIHQSAEAGLGYFGHKNQFSYELYAGYGGGKGHSHDLLFGFWFFDNTLRVASGSYQKFFVQPTFGFRLKRVQMAVTSRVTSVDFDRLLIIENERIVDNPRRRFYVFEPSFTAKFIIKERRATFYGFTQAGFNSTVQNLSSESIIPYAFLHYNVGFGLKL
ncbi:MAG: hypothetical protein ABI477_07960 [Chryseolinea sp.]